jgi:hypothetical protein
MNLGQSFYQLHVLFYETHDSIQRRYGPTYSDARPKTHTLGYRSASLPSQLCRQLHALILKSATIESFVASYRGMV